MKRRLVAVLTAPALVAAALAATPSTGAAPSPGDEGSAAVARLLADATGDLEIVRDSGGRVTFVGTSDETVVDHPAVFEGMDVAAAARAHLDRYGAALGATRAGTSLVQRSVTHTIAGTDVVRYSQEVQGIPVIGGDVVVTLRPDRELASVLSTMSGATKVATGRVADDAAAETARSVVARGEGTGAPIIERLGRWLLDPAVLGSSSPFGARSVWRYDVRRGVDVRRTVLVDDVTGAVLMNLSTINEIDRVICDRENVPSANEPVCASGFERTEGGGPSSVPDVNLAYVLSGEVSTFYQQVGGLDLTALLGVDVGGQPKLASTVRFCRTTAPCPYANAFWNGIQMYYGEGFVSADDVVGHEMTHGVIDQYSQLFYWGQSGAINESFADIMGEIVDHRHGMDEDRAWRVGEDLPIGAIRNMSNPPAFNDPDSTQSALWFPDPNYDDNGGVHFNSGVGNKTAYLISQGGTFGGQTITGIDTGDTTLTKSARLQLLAIQSLSSGSDYADLARVLDQSCQSLRSSAGFTASNCDNVHRATLATRLTTTPANAAQPADAPTTCPAGSVKRVLFNSETGSPATKFVAGPRWVRGSDPDWGSNARSGLDAWSNPGRAVVSTSSLVVTTPIAVPAGRKTYLHFHHWRQLDHDSSGFYDGGVVEVDRTGDPAPAVDTAGLPWVNGPAQVLSALFHNPAPGRTTFGGDSRGYVASRLDLSSFGGQSIKPRFTLFTDDSVVFIPWYVDDITVYTCDLKVTAGKVGIVGKLRVGQRLTAKQTGWAPAGVTFSYRWLRNGKAFPGAKGKAKKYQLVKKDAGKRMSVRVAGKKPGYLSVVVVSKKTGKVKPK